MDIDSLLAESNWLRRLTRSLVQQEADGDDLVQETWLASLRSRTPVTSPRGWFGQLARRAAFHQRRTTTRRSDHEALAEVTREDSPSAGEAAERLELARLLAEGLQQVPEPYRTALYSHYYEGETASAIALRLEVASGTVRWRLARGRKLLREYLCASDGRSWEDWTLALAPLGGLVEPLPTAAVSSLGAMMSIKAPIMGACAGALFAGGTWLFEVSLSATRQVVEPVLEVSAVNDSKAQEGSLTTRRPIGTAPAIKDRKAPSAPGPDALFGVIAYGRVVDPMGAALGGVEVELISSTSQAKVTTDEQGSWSLIDIDPGTYAITLSKPGSVTWEETIAVPAQRVWRHDVALREAPMIPVRFQDEAGEPISADSSSMARYLGVAATSEAPGPRMRVVGRLLFHSEHARFLARSQRSHPPGLDASYHGVLALRTSRPVLVSALYRDVVLETRSVSGTEEELVFTVPDVHRFHGGVRMRVVDRKTGSSLSAGLMLRHSSGGRSFEPRVENGELIFEDLPPGEIRLVSHLAEYELLDRNIIIDPGLDRDLGTIALGHARALQVRTLDAEGNPISVSVSARRLDLMAGPYDFQGASSAKTDALGHASLRRLATGPTLIRAGGGDGHAALCKTVDTTHVDNVELRFPRGALVTFSGLELNRTEFFTLEDGVGSILRSGRTEPYPVSLAPGRYVLRVHAAGVERLSHSFVVGSEALRVDLGSR